MCGLLPLSRASDTSELTAPPKASRFRSFVDVDVNKPRKLEGGVGSVGMRMAENILVVGAVEQCAYLSRPDNQSIEAHRRSAEPSPDRFLSIEYFISAIFQSSSLSMSCVSDSGISRAAVFRMKSRFWSMNASTFSQ